MCYQYKAWSSMKVTGEFQEPVSMARMRFLCSALTCQLLLLVLILIILNVVASGDETKNFYIVYLGASPLSKDSAVQKHIALLSYVKGSEHDAKESMIYSYTKTFNAFAAKLSKDEADMLQEMDEVVSVFPNRYHKLHTTRSWDFIGLPQTARRKLKMERNIVVGLLDTG
ncbi:Peptidase S8 propeptide/proteinase inhibitor I9 - like 1 [Theobroma cacao]|nr:Peptidase S8 propeptide/proteinase inhibitor I9 - like 1 [Theobroma cacao]